MKIGLLGCGNIGKEIVKAVNEKKLQLEIISLFDKDKKRVKELAQLISPHPRTSSNITEFLRGVDLVVEVASQEAVKEYGLKVLKSGKDLMILSVGALKDVLLWKKLKRISKEKGKKIYIPSGAVLGLDGLKAGKMGKLTSVTLITRKNPKNIEGLKNIKKEVLIYEGSAKGVVQKFPKNINVAATLSLTGMGFEKTKVKIIADPKVKKNIHEIQVKGSFGEFQIKTRNKPSPQNPKTSYLTVLSVILTLKEISNRLEERENVEIGS